MSYGNGRPSGNRGRDDRPKRPKKVYKPEDWTVDGVDVSAYMRELEGGTDYLTVQGRLVLFRKAYPKGRVITTLQDFNVQAGFAMFKAEVYPDDKPETLPRAVAFGTETRAGFTRAGSDGYIAKAETVAIGRALLAFGIGLQYAGSDMDEDREETPADAGTPPRREPGAGDWNYDGGRLGAPGPGDADEPVYPGDEGRPSRRDDPDGEAEEDGWEAHQREEQEGDEGPPAREDLREWAVKGERAELPPEGPEAARALAGLNHEQLRQRLFELSNAYSVNPREVADLIKRHTGHTSSKDLPIEDLVMVISTQFPVYVMGRRKAARANAANARGRR